MLDGMIKEVEESIGKDDFEVKMEDCLMKLRANKIEFEAVEPLLRLMERHPLDDFGSPGAIVHFLERFYTNGYEELLITSFKRKPTMHTVWMLNRVINGSESPQEYISLMRAIGKRSDVDDTIKNSAQDFVATWQEEGNIN